MLTGRRRTAAELAATADPIACVPIVKPSIVERQPIGRRGDWVSQEGLRDRPGEFLSASKSTNQPRIDPNEDLTGDGRR
jgi:hypothetical protein